MGRWGYPLLVGVWLGLLQTGLFFQLSFALSASFSTYLLVVLGWLAGSALGVRGLAQRAIPLAVFLLAALSAYGLISLAVNLFPFDRRWQPAYMGLILLIGVYPGVFFARMGASYPPSTLFFHENNGFILGMLLGTLGFMLWGRIILWAWPMILALLLLRTPAVAGRALRVT
jgi:hypothetical protein